MHILNNLTGSKADQFNEPDRAAFYDRYKIFLALLAIIAGGAGMLTASKLGFNSFLILFIMSLLGLSYNLRLVPKWFGDIRYSRIRDIPGSKTILIAVAWGVVTTILPLLSSSKTFGVSSAMVFIWSMGMVFVRTGFFDILDMQGDRIVGKETIPILIGERRSMAMLKIMLVVIFLILIFSSAFRLIPTLGFGLAVIPALMGLVLTTYEKGHVLPFIRLEFLIETHFILAGILAFLWYLF